MSNNVVNNTGN